MSVIGTVHTAMWVWSAAKTGYKAITALRSTVETMRWVKEVTQHAVQTSAFTRRIREVKQSDAIGTHTVASGQPSFQK